MKALVELITDTGSDYFSMSFVEDVALDIATDVGRSLGVECTSVGIAMDS